MIKKKIIKKVVKSVKLSKVEGTKMPEKIENVASSTDVCNNYKIDKLTISFPNEDLNKLVEKMNEIIDKQNGTI